MLGLSVGKLLVLALVVYVAWIGFKYVGRVEAVRRALREEIRRRQQGQGQAQGPRVIEAEDLSKCAVCGAYVAARSATHCGRSDCPWGR